MALGLIISSILAAFDQPGLWGLASYGYTSLPVLGFAILLLMIALVPPVSIRLGRMLLAVPLPIRGPGPFIAGTLAVPAFFLLRTSTLVGDWRLVLERLSLGHYYPSNLWTNYLFRIIALPAHASGLSGDGVIALTSAVSGGVFIAFLLRLSHGLGGEPGRTRFIFWFTFLTGSTLIFFGHLEVYAPLAACLAAFLDAVVRARKGLIHHGVTGLILGITFCFHGSAGLFLPPLLLTVAIWNHSHRARQVTLTMSGFLIPVVLAGAALFFLHWKADPPENPVERYGTFLGAAGQGLITPFSRNPESPRTVYVLSEWPHWRDRINVLLRLAPVALLLAVPLLFRRGKRRFPDDAIRADLHDMFRLNLGVYLVWMAIHNLSFPMPKDWDLFAPVGFLLALFAGLAPRPPHPGRAGALVALCCFTALPWWWTSISPPDTLAARYHYNLARTYQKIGGQASETAFVFHLKSAASIGHRPHHDAVKMLSVYLASRHMPEAEIWLQRAAHGYPQDPELQANLGLWYHGRKKYDRALQQLRTAVDLLPEHPIFQRDLGRLFLELDRVEEAYHHFQTASDLKPADRELTDEAIKAAWKLNRGREGLKLLVRLHGHHPGDVDILKRLVKMNMRVGFLAEAKRYQNLLIEHLKNR